MTLPPEFDIAEFVGGPLDGSRRVVCKRESLGRFPFGLVGDGRLMPVRFAWYSKLVKGGEDWRDLEDVKRFLFVGFDE